MFVILSLLLFTVPGPEALDIVPGSEPADLILVNGRVLTMLEPEPESRPTALACRAGRIAWVGDDTSALALRGAATTVIDLEGRVAMPGLVDGHAHLYGIGKALAEIDLVGASSEAECVARVLAASADAPSGWLQGRGWDQNDWPGQQWPCREVLDTALPGRPILLRRVDGHAAWASSEALRLAGITAATPDPEGGRILRDADRSPTGVLVDNAVDLVRDVVPPPARDEVERRVKLAVSHCLASGLTGFHDMGAKWDRVQIYRQLADRGDLGLRVYCFLDDDPTTLDKGLAAGPFVAGDGMLTVRGVKLYADGALGSRGALLLADYTDQPGSSGLQVTPVSHLREVCRRARSAGFQVATHAIGDRANRLVLDVYADVLGDDSRTARWRVEHAQIVDPIDLPRFASLGVIASMQPVHCTSDMDWVPDRLGPDRLQGAYAWRSLLEFGAALSFGTDAPVEAVDPIPGLFAARTRTHADGTPHGGWQAHECLDGRTALRLYTLGPAYASYLEDQSGVLAPGRWADISVFSDDPTTVAVDRLLAVRPWLTVVNGRVAWAASLHE